MRIGFVGWPRFKTILNFSRIVCQQFSQNEIHIFGGPVGVDFQKIGKYDNCFIHGAFSSPDDLPDIYSQLDIVLSTYDSEFENVRYAEPNKLYEAIFFETPIIVSSGTFLAEKVERLGIGFAIDASSDASIIKFLKSVTVADVLQKQENIKKISKQDCLNNNMEFFDKLKCIIS